MQRDEQNARLLILDREGWLVATMIELAATDAAVFDEAEYASGFAKRLAELVSPAEVGLLIPADGGYPAVAAGSSERAAGLARLEAGGAAGPCTDCHHSGRVTRNESPAAAKTRWPVYAAGALAAGFGIVSALPMRHDDMAIGAVSALSTSDHPLAATEASLAGLLTEAAAIAIRQQRALQRSLRTSQQLQHALDSRVVIEQAKGAVAAWLDITPGDAFELLRGYSRRNSRLLTEVAGDVIRGTIPAHGLVASGKLAGRRATER